MSSPVLYTLLSTVFVSLIAFVGLLTISFKRQWLQKMLIFMISLSAGALLGDSFFHLLPEAVENAGGFTPQLSVLILIGIVGFFILEKFILWHHHHHVETPEDHQKDLHNFDDECCPNEPLRMMNLIGDGFHNLLDGMIIAASFLISPVVGVSTTIAIILHEIPQEIGDFGVLIHTGLSVKKALFFNFLTGTVAILGALIVLYAGEQSENLITYLIPITAGAFIYIAASDLIPELKKVSKTKSSIYQLLYLLIGLGLMYGLLFVE